MYWCELIVEQSGSVVVHTTSEVSVDDDEIIFFSSIFTSRGENRSKKEQQLILLLLSREIRKAPSDNHFSHLRLFFPPEFATVTTRLCVEVVGFLWKRRLVGST